MSDLASGTHHNQRMQQDYNRGDRFSFQVLEHVNGTRDDLNRRENFQIRKHNSFHNGYNQTRGGDYTQTGQKYLNQRKYGGQSNGYRRRYKGKQYTTGTYNPKKDETSLGKCFAGILIVFILFYLIANFINYLITYRPMQFLYGILIIITISVIVYIVYKARLYDKYRQHKNIYYCPTCKKHVKFVDGNCPTCYEKNKKNLEYAKKIQNERVSKKGNVFETNGY